MPHRNLHTLRTQMPEHAPPRDPADTWHVSQVEMLTDELAEGHDADDSGSRRSTRSGSTVSIRSVLKNGDGLPIALSFGWGLVGLGIWTVVVLDGAMCKIAHWGTLCKFAIRMSPSIGPHILIGGCAIVAGLAWGLAATRERLPFGVRIVAALSNWLLWFVLGMARVLGGAGWPQQITTYLLLGMLPAMSAWSIYVMLLRAPVRRWSHRLRRAMR